MTTASRSRHYECAACRYSATISEAGVDRMREHVRTAHVSGPPKIRADAYVVIRHDNPAPKR